jgi:hypothetical protein
MFIMYLCVIVLALALAVIGDAADPGRPHIFPLPIANPLHAAKAKAGSRVGSKLGDPRGASRAVLRHPPSPNPRLHSRRHVGASERCDNSSHRRASMRPAAAGAHAEVKIARLLQPRCARCWSRRCTELSPFASHPQPQGREICRGERGEG